MKYSYKNILQLIPESARLPLVIFLSAMLVHLIHIGFSDWGKDLLSPYAFSDEYLYLHRAWHMAFIDSSGGYLGEILSVTPYSRLVAWGYQLFGDHFWVPVLVNSVLMSFAVMFTALLTRQAFDSRTAWIAGVIGVLCTPFVFFAGLSFKSNLVLAVLAAGLYFSIRYIKDKKLWQLFLATLLITMASTERYQLIFILPLLSLFIFRPLWKQARIPELSKPALVMLSAFLMVLMLTIGHGNHKASTVMSPLGLNIYISYSPGAWGGFTTFNPAVNNIISQRLNSKSIAEKEAGEKLTDWEAHWHWIRKSISYYSSVPQDLFVLQVRKLGMLFAQATQGQPEEYLVWRWHRPALIIAFIDYGLIVSFALFGFSYLRKEQLSRSKQFLFSSLVIYAIGVWIFFVQERYRLPILLMLIPFAAFGAKKLLFDKASSRKLISIPIIALMYGITILLNQLTQAGPGWSEDHYKARNIHQRRFDTEIQIYNLKQSAINENNESAWLNLAIWFDRRGFLPDAISYAKRAILAAPLSFKGYELLIDYYSKTHNIIELKNIKMVIDKLVLKESNVNFINLSRRIDVILNHRE